MAGVQSEVVEAFAELFSADRLAGSSAGEQPARGSLVAETGVAVAGSDELADEGVDGCGQYDGLTAEPEPDLLFVGVNVVEGEAADRGGALGVEENEQPGDAILGFDGVVMEQTTGLFPAGLGVDDAAGSVPADRGEVKIGNLLGFCPSDDVSVVAAPGRGGRRGGGGMP